MKRTAILVLVLLAAAAHAQRTSTRSSDELPRSSRGSRRFDSASAREELGASTADWEAAVTPSVGSARSGSSRRAASASRGQPQPQPQPRQQADSRRRAGAAATRSRIDLQSLEPEQVAASSVIAPVVTQQFVSRRPSAEKVRPLPATASRRRDAETPGAAAAPEPAFSSRRRPSSNDVDLEAASYEPASYTRRRPSSVSAGSPPSAAAHEGSLASRRRTSAAPPSTAPPTAAPAPVFEAPESPPEPSTTTTTSTTTEASAPDTPSSPERVVPPRFDTGRRRSGGGSAAEPEATFAPRQRGGGSSGRRSGGGGSRRGGVSFQDSEAATAAPSRDRSRGSRREQLPSATPRSAATRGRGSSRTTAGSTTSTTTTTTSTTTTTTEAPLLTNPDTEVAPELNGGYEDSNALQQPDAAAAESAAQELSPVPAATEVPQAAVNPRAETSRRKSAEDGGATRQAPAARRGSARSRGGAAAGDDGRSATATASSRRPGSRAIARGFTSQAAPTAAAAAPPEDVLPTGAGAPAAFARTGSRRPSPRSRPTAVDLTTADTSQNDVQPRSSTRSRNHADSVPSNSRRSNRRGTVTPDVDANGNSAGGASVQRTSRKINADTNARPSFKNTRRVTSSKKLTTEASSIKDEIDESENYPPEFIQKIKSSIDTKDEKTTESSLLSSSPEDTFITKSSDKVVSVFTPSLSEDEKNTDGDKENQNNEVHVSKLESRRQSNKYTGRTRSYKVGSDETGKQRKVDLLLAPSPPPEREVTKPTIRSSPRSQFKSAAGYSLRGSRPFDSKKDTEIEDIKKAETASARTPDGLQMDSPITASTQSTRAAFRIKSNVRSHHVSKSETENIVTAPGGLDTKSSQESSPRPSFRRGFPTRARSAAYKSHHPRNEQTSTSTEDNIISSRSYTPRPSSSKTRTTSSFRRSIAATTDDIQNEIQTSAQPPATPRSLVGTQRFSARFRSDLLLATGGLRSTTTPAYIPTVPLIRAASTTTTETSAINDSKMFIPGSESILVSASERSVIPTVTHHIQPQVTFALPSEVSNSVYNVQQNLVEKTTDNGISSTKAEKLNIATQLPINANAQTVPSTMSNIGTTLALLSPIMTVSQTTAKTAAGVPELETTTSIAPGSNDLSKTTPTDILSESTSNPSTVERTASTLLSSVPTAKEKVAASARVTTEPFLSQSATSPSTPLSIRGLISRVLGNITPSIATASTVGRSTVSPIMTVTAKRQLTTMTALPVSSYITERLVTVIPADPVANNSFTSAEMKTASLTTKPPNSQPTTTKAAPVTVTTVKTTTTKATTVKPTTIKTTMNVATSPKTTTSKPTTLKPTTSKPTTPKPTTFKPSTAKSTTSKPSTAKPTTSKPSTVKPTTLKLTTAKPTTPKPTTAKLTTPKSTTAKTTTPKPTTSKPTAPKSTTPKPTTSKPTTPKPTTSKPITPKPTTSKPTTPKPTISKPTTPKPTTSEPTTPRPMTANPTTPKVTTSKPATLKVTSSKPAQNITPLKPLAKSTVAQTASDSTTSAPFSVTSSRNSLTYSPLSTLESDIKYVESESVQDRNSWQMLDRRGGSLEELSLLNILAQNVDGKQEQRKAILADKVIEAALQRSSTTALPLFNNNLPKPKVIQTLENGVESNRFSLDLLGQQSRNIKAPEVSDAPSVTSSIVELETSKNNPVVSSKSPTVETVTSGKLSPQDEQLLLALFGNQISGALQQPKPQNTRSRSRLSPEEQLLAALLREQASAANYKTTSKGGQQQKEQNSEGHSPSTSAKPKSQGLPVTGKLSEEELLLSLLGGQPKTAQKATEQVNSTHTKLSDEEILAALLSGQSKGATRTVGTTQRVSTKPRRLLTDEQIISGLLAGSTPASPADQARLAELLNGGRHKTRITKTTTPAVPRGLGFLLARPGSQGLFSSALQPDAGSIDPAADLSGGEDGVRGPREQGTLVKAAIDVTKAVSQFMSAVIQGATRSFQSFFRSGTNLLSQYFSLGSAQAGNFQLR